MPHRVLSEAELNKELPSIEVPPEVDAGDPFIDQEDGMLKYGMDVAERIALQSAEGEDANSEGRSRDALIFSVKWSPTVNIWHIDWNAPCPSQKNCPVRLGTYCPRGSKEG